LTEFDVFSRESIDLNDWFAAGNRPPGQVPAKGQYIAKDLHYLSEYYKVPVQMIAVSYVLYSLI